MKYRNLMGTDLTVSEVGFGVWSVSTGWWGKVEEADAIVMLNKALELGITLFDTADAYGGGYGEEILAKALSRHRSRIVIGTKLGYDLEVPRSSGHKERPQRWDAPFIKNACEMSLKRLNTDCIDLYQLHNPRLDALQRDDTFAALEDLQKEGKIRHIAAAIGPDLGWLEEGIFAIEKRGIPAQIIYSILEQEPARHFIASAKLSGIGLFTRVPHASGMLDGTYTKDTNAEISTFPEGDHRAHRKAEWMHYSIERLRQLDFLFESATGTIGQIAINFCLQTPEVASCIPTIVTLEHLEEYADAPNIPAIPESALIRLNELWENGFGQNYRQTMRSSVTAIGDKG